ncbi:shufflon system plasmid conjugative transfer pilus tip adhesin PilV [Salmonella enterica]|uniref:shufflon system plasmid conjugative transfer pilus tip adhesin PilV n=2 Tax=Enterobacterales TaxID=91347 RepID=UPI0009AF17A7|nr:shufflon system plasmid conjugative transfer pilus tip adhesin PilV [Salmonella enterica]EDN4217905.1 shufflon system plasmid conjugative transfer pilus tip adhesin PilV [Salmonella enterica subsp. enterica]EDU0252395.1 shufflon system plasmid conjugative transfer pilus tip adhesin PilV [Salmonella enterica subsp. enterica serovar Saintpaul]EDX3542084.1 shufflon system plasmid conjugative transfer pilus tip adhesin PilV [Salmonella enterica subsp. enterica serovar Braenderup]EJJ3590410.1 shu
MKKQKHDGGFVAMSVGAGLLIVLVMASMAARYMGDYLKSREWQVVAMQTNRFTQAASSYVGRYYPTVLASATTTKPVVVTSQMLKNTGLLPASFSETNSYGQQYQAMIVRNQQNQELLQGMVVSRGGHAMPFTALNQISKDITAGFGGYVEDGQTAVGAMRSWRIALSSYGTSTGRGHLAVMLSTDDLSGAREDGDRLYRFQVNGRPDLNKMHTAIDMGGNNLNSVGTVTASNIASQNGNFGVSLVSNGPVTAGGDIRSTGGWIVTRSGKGWMDETHGGGLYMSDNDWLRILNNKGFYTGGEIRGGKVRSDGDVSVGGVLDLDKINVANTYCPKDGSVSRTATGAPLSCQSGIWTLSGKISSFEMIPGNDACGKYIYSKAYCPAGKQLVSGGYILSKWSGGSGWNSPDLSMPAAAENAWQIYTGGGVTGGTCMRAIAWCAKN